MHKEALPALSVYCVHILCTHTVYTYSNIPTHTHQDTYMKEKIYAVEVVGAEKKVY